MSYKAVILGCGPRAAFHLDAYKENLPEIELVADPSAFGYGHVHVSQS